MLAPDQIAAWLARIGLDGFAPAPEIGLMIAAMFTSSLL